MTIEEKRAEIKSYCLKSGNCVRYESDGNKVYCPIFTLSGSCYNNADDEIVERNFKLISTMPDYRGMHEDEVSTDVNIELPTHDPVNHPSHYTQGGMECIDEMVMLFGTEAVMHFCVCNAWKYRKRAMFKNGQEDLDKADWYLNKYKELSSNG